ncbi:MAG: hypothetical protein ISQ09_11225 [Rubripirellula sp.]|nr:hypothetical protein [Rubripirellula sp.]
MKVLAVCFVALAAVAAAVAFLLHDATRGTFTSFFQMGLEDGEYMLGVERLAHGASDLFYVAATLSTLLALAGILLIRLHSRLRVLEPTKPVEPTGTSSFSSDLITSQAPGESPGGSLRRST